jgi:type II secretory pathway component PulC
MSLDVLLRRGALIAIPVAALALFFARDRVRAPNTPAPSSSEPAPVASSDGLAAGFAERGESALANKPSPEPQTPSAPTAAVELPLADSPTLSRAQHHSGSSEPARPRASHASPCGGVEARVITASEDPSWAFASLAPAFDQPALIRHVGERIGSWQVEKIEWDRVWLRGAGTRCAVGMHFGARQEMEALADAGVRRKGLVLDDAPDPKEPWRVPGEIANSIDKLRETEFAVERAMVEPIFDRAGELFYGLSVEPARKGDQVVGLTLGEVKTDSLLERLGLETGDVVLAIDDEPAKSLEAVIEALGAAREHDRLVARVERAGEPFDLRVVVR